MDTVDNSKRVGIDFGTSTTLVADRLPNGVPECIALGAEGSDWIPTLVGVDDRNAFVVGDEALALPAARVISSVKAHLTQGRRWLEVRDATGQLCALSADDVITRLLEQVRSRLVAFESDFFDHAILNLACPASWDQPRRDRLVAAARAAGLPASPGRMFDEPVAAGTGFLHHCALAGEPVPHGLIVVVDAGGGTLDVAILQHSAEGLRVLHSSGNELAGDRIDSLIAEDLALHAPAPPRWIDPHGADTRAALVQRAARELKERLTDNDRAERPLFGTSTTLALTRNRLEDLVAPMVEDLGATIDAAVRRSSGSPHDAPWSAASRHVVAVQLAGGTTRVPAVADLIRDRFPNARVGPDPMLRQHEAAVVAGLTYL